MRIGYGSGGDAGSRLIFFGAGIAGRLGVGMSEVVSGSPMGDLGRG
jgi:hypothetical protein